MQENAFYYETLKTELELEHTRLNAVTCVCVRVMSLLELELVMSQCGFMSQLCQRCFFRKKIYRTREKPDKYTTFNDDSCHPL